MPRKNLHSEIAKVAYEIYIQRGCVHGHDIDQWLEAEKMVLSNRSSKPKKKEKGSEITPKVPSKKVLKPDGDKKGQKGVTDSSKRKGSKKQ
jgi:Protein of unknown function (DUF2934)